MNRIGVTLGDPAKIAPYEDALRAVGLDPVLIRAGQVAPNINGLLLTGGTDVDPALYGQPKGDRTQDPDVLRDTMESGLLAEALAANLPVLAICRGMQLFNVHHGGTLIQHIDGHQQRGAHDAHTVEVIAGTRLAAIVGAGTHAVNSRHHQIAGEIGAGLVISARSAEGFVEGLELPVHRFAVAVQWHPEDRIHSAACDRLLFEAFAATLKS